MACYIVRMISEQARSARLDAFHVVVVEHEAADAAILGEYARLRLDLLCGEDSGDRSEVRVTTQQLEIARELLDALNVFKIRLLLYNRRVFKWRKELCDVSFMRGNLRPGMGLNQ